MEAQVLREKLATIRGRKFFSVMADEGTVVKAIKDILMRCSLSLDDCRGQPMMGPVTC